MSGWTIGFVVGGVVVLLVVVLLVTMIVLARRINSKAEDIHEGLLDARDNTAGLWGLSATQATVDRINSAAGDIRRDPKPPAEEEPVGTRPRSRTSSGPGGTGRASRGRGSDRQAR